MFCPNGSSGILKFGHLSYKHYLLLLICINQSECAYIGCIFSATSRNFCKQTIVYLSTRFTKPPSSSSPYCVAEIIAANILFLSVLSIINIMLYAYV